MNSDMERLCEAVEVVCDHHGMMACDEDHKAIVRAVLATLPTLEGGHRYEAGEWSRRNAEALTADVLGE